MEPLTEAALRELEHGTLHRFDQWGTNVVPAGPPGVYTVWWGERFVYVGMGGRSEGGAGLRGRLLKHVSGRRSGNQFCIYVCDRFVLPTLSPEQIAQVGEGTLRLDRLVQAFIHEHLAYRFVLADDSAGARSLERLVQVQGLSGRRPLLNVG